MYGRLAVIVVPKRPFAGYDRGFPRDRAARIRTRARSISLCGLPGNLSSTDDNDCSHSAQPIPVLPQFIVFSARPSCLRGRSCRTNYRSPILVLVHFKRWKSNNTCQAFRRGKRLGRARRPQIAQLQIDFGGLAEFAKLQFPPRNCRGISRSIARRRN